MATINITVPDDKVNDLIAALGAENAAGAKAAIILHLKSVYRNYKNRQTPQTIDLS